jgi:transposase
MTTKNYYLNSSSDADGAPRGQAELFAAPPPPARGKIIALDCHPDTFTAAVFRGSTPHDARQLALRDKLSLEALLAWTAKEFTSEDLFLMEAGSNSFEVCRRLQAQGLRAVVLESAHVGRQAKLYADNDKLAAARIAYVFLAGNAPCVWQPDAKTCERRELLHVYLNAVTGHTAAGNSLKGYLNQFGLRLGKKGLTHEQTRSWILGKRVWTELQQQILAGYFSDFDYHAQRRKQTLHLICQEICAEPLMLRCMKLLGIGKINAFALLACIGDIRRFERSGKLVAYLGLNPGQRQSGTSKHVKLGIGEHGRPDLRHLLIQSGHAILRMGKNTALGKWGWALFARKGQRNIAVVAVARKLAVQVWHLLKGHPPTQLESDQSLTLKLERLLVSLGKALRQQLGLPAQIKDCVQELRRRIQGLAPSEPASALQVPD